MKSVVRLHARMMTVAVVNVARMGSTSQDHGGTLSSGMMVRARPRQEPSDEMHAKKLLP